MKEFLGRTLIQESLKCFPEAINEPIVPCIRDTMIDLRDYTVVASPETYPFASI